MTTNKSLPVDKDIYKTQAGIIESQRQQIKDLTQRLEFAQDMNREYTELRTLFAQNPGANWSQIQSVIMTRQNAIVQADRERINYERRSKIEAEEATRREVQEKQVLADNPNLSTFAQQQRDKILATKKMMLEKATCYYDLEDDQVKIYASLTHKPENSAVRDLLETSEDDKGMITYKCRYCEKIFDGSKGLAKFEIHCYSDDQAGHRSHLLRTIERDASQSIAKVDAELQKDINDVIKSKADAVYRARIAKERAAATKAAKDLPFVS